MYVGGGGEGGGGGGGGVLQGEEMLCHLHTLCGVQGPVQHAHHVDTSLADTVCAEGGEGGHECLATAITVKGTSRS